MRILNSLIVLKYIIKRETLWAFWNFSLLQNITKNLKMGPFEGEKKSKKNRIVPKKIESRTVSKKIARKSFWLRQGLEPVTAGFTVNRVKTVLTSTRERVKSVKSGTYTMRSVVWRKKKKTRRERLKSALYLKLKKLRVF